MDITVYLPDEVGLWAKDEKINLSQLLRGEVEAERRRRTAVAQTLERATVAYLPAEDHDRRYRVRMHGTALHEKAGDVQAYLGEDGRVYAYNESSLSLSMHDPSDGTHVGNWLGDMLGDQEYIEAMASLGEEAVIDVGLAAPAPDDVPAARRSGKARYTNCVVCGWRFTQAGGQTRPNCQAPRACRRRVKAGWLPGIGDPASPHNLGNPAMPAGTARVTVPQAKALQATALANGMLPGYEA